MDDFLIEKGCGKSDILYSPEMLLTFHQLEGKAIEASEP
jgi:hypothetical protein